jgi:hypothetical protein
MVPETVAPVVLVARSVFYRPHCHPLRLGWLSMLQLTHFIIVHRIDVTCNTKTKISHDGSPSTKSSEKWHFIQSPSWLLYFLCICHLKLANYFYRKKFFEELFIGTLSNGLLFIFLRWSILIWKDFRSSMPLTIKIRLSSKLKRSLEFSLLKWSSRISL